MRFQIDVHLDDETFLRTLAEDVRRGLTSCPKYLLPKYFYDSRGSALFERITQLQEYYLTRVELGIIQSIAQKLMEDLHPDDIVEIGSGSSSSKIRHLLDVPGASEHVVRYVPFDVDEKTIETVSGLLIEDYPFLRVHGVVGDFERHLAHVPRRIGRRLAIFFGSTIGNLHSQARRDMLTEIRSMLTSEDRLLLGLDTVKETAVLEAAYNDSRGVTAGFNKNILRVVNRALTADFRPDLFRHCAYYNHEASRMEMHLIPESPQCVHLRDLALTVYVSPHESIWTESSYKFTHESAEQMPWEAGLKIERWDTDSGNMFALLEAALR